MGEGQPAAHHASRVTHHLPVVLSCFALLASFAILIQIDIPLARLFRSVHVLWLEQVGDVGAKLGSGLVLTTISLVVLVTGVIFKWQAVRSAGIESLLAHGVVAVLTNGLKHLIGRPRPRFTHAGGFQFWPSWDSGLDSFPSGHASASFAVATVLAKYVPQAAWGFYGIASWIAASRVWRGSHFPTDVLAGVFLGVTVGMVASRPIRGWRESLGQAVAALAPYAVAVTALLWIACHAAPQGVGNVAFMAAGVVCIVAGLGSRLLTLNKWIRWSWVASRPLANVLIAMGLALTTGSLIVIGIVGLAAQAAWCGISQSTGANHAGDSSRIDAASAVAEGLYAAAVVSAAIMLHGLKGIIPMQ